MMMEKSIKFIKMDIALILLSGCANWDKHLDHQKQKLIGEHLENTYAK